MRRKAGNHETQTELIPVHRWEGTMCFIGHMKVGWLYRDGYKRVFVSPRQRDKHYFIKYSGWGVTKDLILDLAKKGVKEFWLKLPEGYYRTNLKNFINFGTKHRNESSPHELQLILGDTFFGKVQ